MTENPFRTAILLGGGVREALMAQSVVRAIPGAIVFATPEAIGSLLGLPGMGRAFVLDDSVRGWLSAFRRLRTGPIDRVVMTPPVSLRASALAYFSGVQRRLRLAGAAPPSLQPPAAVRQRLVERLSGFLEPGSCLTIIPGGGNWSSKRAHPSWAPERFAVVANQSGARRVLILAGAGDEGVVAETRAGIARPSRAVSLAELTIEEAAVIAEVSLAVIGHDGDALHVAAAGGGTVLGLLGRGDVAPKGARVTQIQVDDFDRLLAQMVVEQLVRQLQVTSYA